MSVYMDDKDVCARMLIYTMMKLGVLKHHEYVSLYHSVVVVRIDEN